MKSEFIKRFNERDEIAFRIVFEALYPKFLRYAQKTISSYHDAEDMVLRVFAGLWFGKAVFEEYAAIEAYIYYEVKNRCINYFKGKKRTVEFKDYDFSELTESEPINRNRLLKLINQLPDIYKNVLLLEIEGLNGVEIAKIENTTHPIIAKRRWVAIQKIKSLLKFQLL